MKFVVVLMTGFSNNTSKATATATKAKRAIRKRRPRRELPDDLTEFYIADGERPSALDVIAGRGGGANHHEGNKRYWRRILAERPGYKQLGKNDNTEKNEIAQAIYNFILSTGGRFLQLERGTQKWFNLPQKIGLDKIKQALRDKYVPNFFEGEPTMPTSFLDEKEQFMAAINQAPMPMASKMPMAPPTDFISTPSLDLASIFGQTSLEKMEMFKSGDFINLLSQPSSNKIEDVFAKFPTNDTVSFNFNLRDGNSLDNLMRGDLIATCDNMTQAKITAPQAPMSLQAILQQQMESAIPSSRTVAAI